MAKTLDTGTEVIRRMMEILSALGQSSEKSPITRADKKDFKEAMKEQGNNSVVLYETKGSLYREFLSQLREAGIPFEERRKMFGGKESKVIAVPKAYEAHADKVVGDHNKLVDRLASVKSFEDAHRGETVLELKTNEEESKFLEEALSRVTLDRKSEKGASIKSEQGVYESTDLHYFSEKDATVAEAVLFLTKATLNGQNREHTVNAIESRERARKEIFDLSTKGSSTLSFADAQDTSVVYQVDEIGLHRTYNKRTVLVAVREDKDYETRVASAVKKMDTPIFAENTKAGELLNVYSKDEIRAAKEGMAIADAGAGKIAQAESIAAQIVAMRVSLYGLANQQTVNALNSALTFSEVIANGKSEDNFRKGVDELADRYEKLGLSPEEDRAVLRFMKDCCVNAKKAISEIELSSRESEFKDVEPERNTVDGPEQEIDELFEDIGDEFAMDDPYNDRGDDDD